MKKNQILTIGAVVLMLGIFIGSLFIKEPPRKHLTIVHVNDTHSHFEPLRSGAEAGLGGIIERAAYIDSVRAADGAENVLLLHAGDFSQGTTYFSELGGNLEIQEINNMGYDVVTLGNHEFDNGIEALGRRLSSLNCPVVCCNYDFSPFEAGQYIKPYVILEKAGLKIGVIGVLCNLKAMVAAEISNRIPEFPV
ncbi:MAG: metallophosphoesterase, partial [Bacteroidales bacterium]|nr:metallophosphoesterase [Bacteroidales bacterium]